MEIEINRDLTNDLSGLVNANKTKLELYNKKKYVICAILAVAGIILILGGPTGNSRPVNDLIIALGVLAELIVIRLFFFLRSSNARFLKDRIKSLGDDKRITITINNLFLSYRDHERYLELKWTQFSSYKEYKGYIFLLTGNDILSSFAINEAEMTREQLAEFRKFLSTSFST
jgi:hypothetical protein